MADFSIEAAMERIVDSRSRSYFSEVWSSYAHGNYRSSTVMLWSVVVCDLLFKLDEMKASGDTTASAILNEIDTSRKSNPHSPDWEWELVDKVKARTHLLEAADYYNLISLRNHRHLSAHPVLTAVEALFTPTKEQARAHIRNTLEGLLTKPAIMTRKIFDAFVEDVEQKQAVLPDDASLQRYLNAKFLGHLSPSVEDSLLRSLWKLVFKSADPRCEANRAINYRTLRILYERRPDTVRGLLSNDRNYYSDMTFSGSQLNSILDFLENHPNVFPLLTEAAATPLRNSIQSLDMRLTAWFLEAGVADHLADILRRVEAGEMCRSKEAFARMHATAKANGLELKACEIGVSLYGRSGDFDAADMRCENFILPYLQDYDTATVEKLLRVIESNGQTYGRRQATHDHRLIKQAVDRILGANPNLAAFPSFVASLRA